MKKYILLNYFSDFNLDRKKEYLFCLQKNLNLKFITKIFIFIENNKDKNDLKVLNNSKKIEYVKINKRFEFRDAILYSQKFLKNSVIIILNLDIFLEDSKAWKNIDKEFFLRGHLNKALVCYRNNIFKELIPKNLIKIENLSFSKGDCCDAWILKTPINENFLLRDFNFCVGNAPGCDGLMMGLLNFNYHLYSWGTKYKIFHYDICRKVDQNRKKYNFYKNGYILNNKADIRPTLRFTEWMRVPPNQDWNFLLKNRIKPKVFFSHIRRKNFFYAKVAYYFLVFRFNQLTSILKKILIN
jgi:hypothetical protein